MTAEIRIDTGELKKKARRLQELSAIFNEMGNRVNRDCLGAPSYDGQLSNPARGAAAQVLYETGAMRDAFHWSGSSMEQVADQFEKTDKDSIEYYINFYKGAFQWSINVLKYVFLGITPLEGDMTNGYKKTLAYEENGDIITIWCGGKPISIDLSDPSLDPYAREVLKEKLEKYKSLMKEYLGHLKNYIGGDENLFMLALGMLATGIKITDLPSWIGKLGAIAKGIGGNEEELSEAQSAYDEAAAIWEELNSGDLPGKVLTP